MQLKASDIFSILSPIAKTLSPSNRGRSDEAVRRFDEAAVVGVPFTIVMTSKLDNRAVLLARDRCGLLQKGNTVMNDDTESLMTMTADIVAAHVSNNSVAVSDLPLLIANVHHALAGLGGQSATPAGELNLTPAVSIRTSVKADLIACLDCGKKMKMLKRHLMTYHQMTPDQYRAKWSLPKTYPMVASDYAATRRTLALTIGLGRKPGAKVAKAK